MKKTVHTVWILNLAIADFTFSFFLLFNIVHLGLQYHWPLGQALCQFQGATVFLNLFASIYLLMVISIDRWVSMWCPVWAWNHRTPRLASLVVVGIWILALVFCSPDLYIKGNYSNEETDTILCYDNHDIIGVVGRITPPYAVVIVRFIFGFTVPFSVIVLCYGAIVWKLRRDRLSQSSRPFQVIKAVIVAFLVCWFPFHIFSILELKYLSESSVNFLVFVGLRLSYSLAFFNSCLNPILYFCMGYNFKERLRCSLLSTLANAFAEDGNPSTTNRRARSSAELESHSL